jgi:hypothetical protein
MSINIAARRGAKNQRRKAVVAQKRKMEMDAGSISGQVRLAAAEPVQHCLLSGSLFDVGMGTLVLARGATPYSVTMVVFLLDTMGTGVKDVFMRAVSGREFDEYVDQMSFTAPMTPIDPGAARKLLRDLVAGAREVGFAPHRDYPRLEPIFGGIKPAAREIEALLDDGDAPLLIGDTPEREHVLSEPDGLEAD